MIVPVKKKSEDIPPVMVVSLDNFCTVNKLRMGVESSSVDLFS